jgi:hypothetical protein
MMPKKPDEANYIVCGMINGIIQKQHCSEFSLTAARHCAKESEQEFQGCHKLQV